MRAMDGAGHVSQRRLAEAAGLGLGQVNRMIHALLAEGHVRVQDTAIRPYAYLLTAAGRAHIRQLHHEQDARVVNRYREVQERIRTQLARIRGRGIERVVFYGAGEVMEVAHPLAEGLGLRVVGVVDDDPAKRGAARSGVSVASPAVIASLHPDAVIITTLRHADEIRTRLGPGTRAIPVVEL